ncbi:hypothetical protein JCM10369A_12540 [Nocardioides pyridinolyticus]
MVAGRAYGFIDDLSLDPGPETPACAPPERDPAGTGVEVVPARRVVRTGVRTRDHGTPGPGQSVKGRAEG